MHPELNTQQTQQTQLASEVNQEYQSEYQSQSNSTVQNSVAATSDTSLKPVDFKPLVDVLARSGVP